MESFTVQCTSCESRIRVRNPNMIGQIANCPKCGSMLLIAPPQKITVQGGNPTDSLAMTRDALPSPDLQPAAVPQLASPADPSIASLAVAHSSEPESNQPEGSDPLGLDTASPDPFHTLSDGSEATAAAGFDEDLFEGLPTSAWTPELAAPPKSSDADASIHNLLHKRQEAAKRSKQLMLIVGLGSLSLVLALGMLFLFLSWFAKPKATVGKTSPANSPQQLVPPVENIAPDNIASDRSAEDAAQPSSQSEPSNSAPTSPLSELVATPASPEISPEISPERNPAQPTAQPASASETASAPQQPSKLPKMGGSIAPSLDEVLGPSDAPQAAVSADALPPGLQQFSKLFSAGLEPTLTDAVVPPTKAPEIAEEAVKPEARIPTIDILLPPVVDKKLDLQLAGLLIDKRPLSEVLTTLALLGALPVMADLDSLLAGGLPRNPQIEFRATAPVKLGEVFKSIEQSTGLAFVPWENRVLFARSSDDRLHSHVPAELTIADLVATGDDSQALVQALQGVLPELAAMQVDDGGKLTLDLDNENRLVWFQLARLLQSWRDARGVGNSPAASRNPEVRLSDWPVEAMRRLAQYKFKQQLPAEPLARSWQRIGNEAKVVCWIDWYNLTLAEISLSQKQTMYSPGRSLEDLLQSYANRYRVTFAIEDAGSLWITTPDAHRYQPRLYLLPLTEKSMEQWEQELGGLDPLNPGSGESMLKLVPTPDGQYLFVRACRPVLVQPE